MERICEVKGCNEIGQHTGNYRKDGSIIRRKHCNKHHIILTAEKRGMTGNQWLNSFHPYKKWRKDYCENIDGRLGFECTTTIVDIYWQLEVDHIDENNDNDDPSNLQTLCSCCHRIKSKYYRLKDTDSLNLMMEIREKTNNTVELELV